MDEGIRRSVWITLGLTVAAYASLNHPLPVILLGTVFAVVWVVRGGSVEPIAKRLRGLQSSVIDAVFDRHAAGAATTRSAKSMPAAEGVAGGGAREQRTAEELSGMLRDLCGGGGEFGREGFSVEGAPGIEVPPEAARTPDYAGAVIGYREWLLMPRSPDPAALYSITRQAIMPEAGSGRPAARRHQRWPLGETHEAGCGNPSSRGGPDGACGGLEGCACGFYVWNAAGRLGAAGRKGYAEQTSYLVPGVIAGWGRVSLHEKGFRCRYAKVVALLDPGEVSFAQGNDPEGDREAYAELVERSGLPTLSWRELREPDLARRLGLLDARELAR